MHRQATDDIPQRSRHPYKKRRPTPPPEVTISSWVVDEDGNEVRYDPALGDQNWSANSSGR